MALRERQRRFIEEFLVDGNGAAAYRRAGYQARTNHAAAASAHKLLTKADVAAAIAEAQAKRAERTQITADWVIQKLREEATRHGPDSSHGARVTALRLLGQHLGMFPKKLEVNGPGGKPIETARELSDDELNALLAASDICTAGDPTPATNPPAVPTAALVASDALPDRPTRGDAW
jgi:phage terminase small subunit